MGRCRQAWWKDAPSKGRIRWGPGYSYSFKVFPQQLLITKGKMLSIQDETTHFNQVIKINITTKIPPNVKLWGDYHLYSITSKLHNLDLNVRKTQTNPGWGPFRKINGLASSKMFMLWETKQGWGIVPDERK